METEQLLCKSQLNRDVVFNMEPQNLPFIQPIISKNAKLKDSA